MQVVDEKWLLFRQLTNPKEKTKLKFQCVKSLIQLLMSI